MILTAKWKEKDYLSHDLRYLFNQGEPPEYLSEMASIYWHFVPTNPSTWHELIEYLTSGKAGEFKEVKEIDWRFLDFTDNLEAFVSVFIPEFEQECFYTQYQNFKKFYNYNKRTLE